MAVSRYRRVASGLDMYRKVPIDLLEGTKRGSIVSYIAIATMTILFLLETSAFYKSSHLETNVALDTNSEPKLRVNFNITMMDLKCDYVVVDVVSALGTAQNVTSHVNKFHLDAEGVRARYAGRNKMQSDVVLSDSLVVDSLEELHENGEDAVSLDPTTLGYARDEYEYLFVDFYASWCSHCRDLAPTWEVLAEAMTEAAAVKIEADFEHRRGDQDSYSEEEYAEALQVELPVLVSKIDCVIHRELCLQQQIWGYPTLRLFVDGDVHGDYRGDRTVLEMVHWLAVQEEEHKSHLGEEHHNVKLADEAARELLNVAETREEMTEDPGHSPKPEDHKEWAAAIKRHQTRQKALDWKEEEHPGCQISGFLFVDRVPGNFHIQARSPHHDIAAHMTNVSHEVHHLSFGSQDLPRTMKNQKFLTPPNFETTLNPLDGNVYVNHNDHEAFHHYLKVVTTSFDDPFVSKGRTTFVKAYQILSSSQLSFYRNDIVPEAKFSYDPSPIAVYHRRYSKRRWYDYLTSLMAIIGGTFTVIGLIENTIHAAMNKKKL